MKKILTIIGLFGGLTLCQAQSFFAANLDGVQEVPSNSSPAVDKADFTLNGTTLTLVAQSDSNQYFNFLTHIVALLGVPTTSTVNDAAPGNNGPVLFDLTLGPIAINGATITWLFSGSGTLTAGEIADLDSGDLYVNLESTAYPGGEIRGQIEAVPEPSILALIVSGSLALLAGSFRRTGAEFRA
jgi:hypothetical protein